MFFMVQNPCLDVIQQVMLPYAECELPQNIRGEKLVNMMRFISTGPPIKFYISPFSRVNYKKNNYTKL